VQYVELDLQHQNFYCPATGACLCHDDPDKVEFLESPMDAPSCQAFWVGEVLHESMDESDFKDEAFRQAWTKFEEQFEEDYWGIDELRDFLKSYPAENWATYEITTSGMACGPVSSTVWWVLDMDYVSEE
jgi:hypothetical protein